MINTDSIRFIEKMRLIPKSDLHNHASYGGNISQLSEYFHTNIQPPEQLFSDLQDLREWFENNINNKCGGIKGYILRVQSAFIQAAEDKIILLSMSFCKAEIDMFHGMSSFISIMESFRKRFAPDTIFLPELSLRREISVDTVIPWIDEILEYRWFKSIDISGDESMQPISNFIPVYRLCKKYNLRLKAHVGEFGSAYDVMEAVEVLQLSEVHHGIAAADSVSTMKWLAKEKIQLNICPTSNIMLGRVKSYEKHPIRAFYDFGIPVTINTDDMLIFNSSVSQEYMKLYQSGVFTITELEQIRLQGLKSNG